MSKKNSTHQKNVLHEHGVGLHTFMWFVIVIGGSLSKL